MVISKQRLEVCLLACGVAVSRFAFRSHELYDLDSVNFALALKRFDPRVHQPHPPGYFLYICLGRLMQILTHDANLALVMLSILAGVGTVILIYMLALEWFGERAAWFAGLLFLFSPLAWFHGTVALTYAVEAAASALLGFLCWRIDRGRPAYVVPSAIALGIAAGVRPSSVLFLGPLFLFSLRSVPMVRRVTGIAVLCLTSLSWFLPMIGASGGFAAYFGALASLWRMVPSKDTLFNSSPVTSVARAIVIVFIYFLCFGAGCVAPLGCRFGDGAKDKSKKLFTAVWMSPALLFFTFIFLKLVNSGYLLLVAAPACVWLGVWTADWYDHPSWPKQLKWSILGGAMICNVLIFMEFPAYCSYGSVRRFEAELRTTEATLPQLGAPDKLLIVAFDNHLLGYRHAGYYLPDYVTLEYPEATLIEGKRIFAMQGRDSFLLSELPSTGCSRFVLFPLPAGDQEYARYLEKIEKLMPSNDLRSTELDGHRYVTAPISDLRLLFPDAALARGLGLESAPNVYTLRATSQSQP